MARPTTVPQWDSAQVNTIALVPAHTTSGFTDGEVPTAAEFNELFNLYYQWLNWLNGNVLDQNWEFTGNVQVDGTTSLVGNVGTDVTLASGKRLKLQGTGDVAHGTYDLAWQACGGSGTMTNGNAVAQASAASQYWQMPLTGLRAGDRINANSATNMSVNIAGGSTVMEIVEFDLAAGGGIAILSNTHGSTTGYAQLALALTGSGAGYDVGGFYTLQSGKAYYAQMTSSASGDKLYSVAVRFDRP